jgi:gamma-glutamyltranspeptidase / glutathione hydrolase / leukotriene-C4 hydrolase
MLLGPMAIATPGELLAYHKAYKEFGGGVSWSAVFEPAIRLCENGFKVSIALGAAIEQKKNLILNDTQLK